MKVPPGGGRAAVRSIGKLVERHRQCAAVSAPVVHPRIYEVRHHAGEEKGFGVARGERLLEGTLRDEVRLMQRTLPSWGRQLQPERGFLGIGDGDEDIGLSKHFEQDRVIGYF